MNRLLALAEFSSTSDAAGHVLHYAAGLAQEYRLPLTLLYPFAIPVPITGPDDMMLPLMPIADTSAIARQRLNELVARMQGMYTDLTIDGQLVYGEALSLDDENSGSGLCTLVVANDLARADAGWLDAEVLHLLRNAQHTVVAVPDDYEYKKVSAILFALDPESDPDRIPAAPLLDWVHLTGSALHVLVVGGKHPVSEAVRDRFAPAGATFHAIAGADDLEAAILQKAAELGAGWLAVAPHEHGIIGSLFHRGHMQAIAKGSRIPLVALHEAALP